MPDIAQPLERPKSVIKGNPNLPHGEANLTPLAQLRRMQRVLYADVIDPDTEKRLRPQCACAWEKLEGRKAALTMKPAPKPIDVADLERNKAKARAARAGARPPGWRPKVVPKGQANVQVNSPEVRPADADASPGAS